MMSADPEEIAAIDEALSLWRQGDYCLTPGIDFLQYSDLARPLSDAAKQTAELLEADGEMSVQAVATPVEGLAIVSQSCDVIRQCSQRPFVEVSPLVQVDAEAYEAIARGKRPQFAAVPSLANMRLVIDLDRTMTVEKSIVAAWDRGIGCSSDDQVRELAGTLAARRNRAAFPDDFVAACADLQKRIKKKHGNASSEGQHLLALREIRVRAAPSWTTQGQVHLEWWFVRDGEPIGYDPEWRKHIASWMKLFKAGRYVTTFALPSKLEDMTARDYVESDKLELDSLST